MFCKIHTKIIQYLYKLLDPGMHSCRRISLSTTSLAPFDRHCEESRRDHNQIGCQRFRVQVHRGGASQSQMTENPRLRLRRNASLPGSRPFGHPRNQSADEPIGRVRRAKNDREVKAEDQNARDSAHLARPLASRVVGRQGHASAQISAYASCQGRDARSERRRTTARSSERPVAWPQPARLSGAERRREPPMRTEGSRVLAMGHEPWSRWVGIKVRSYAGVRAMRDCASQVSGVTEPEAKRSLAGLPGQHVHRALPSSIHIQISVSVGRSL